MQFSQPTPTYKFLLDENVRQELYAYLTEKDIEVKLAPKGALDKRLAVTSKSEKRIIVTNDEDFSQYSKDKVYAVIWLRIPQNNEQALLRSFKKLLREIKNFTSKLIILYDDKWEEFPLIEELEI